MIKIGVKLIYCCKESEYIVNEIDDESITEEDKQFLNKYTDDYFFDDFKMSKELRNEKNITENEYNECTYKMTHVIC